MDLYFRGLDIPSVEWVLQWEPPTSPSALVHRAGRSARGGCAGASLLPLLPTEDSYVPFIKNNQKVELKDYKSSNDVIKITDKLRDKVGILRETASFIICLSSHFVCDLHISHKLPVITIICDC